MFFIGIDIAKRKHDAVVIDNNGTVIQKAFSFSNSLEGYNKLISIIKKITSDKTDIVFAMESTSHYWLALYSKINKRWLFSSRN